MMIAKVKRISAIASAALLLTVGSTGLLTPSANATGYGKPVVCKYQDTPYAYAGSGNKHYTPGQFCVSQYTDGRYFSIFQTDGNLVTYSYGRATWSSGTAGLGATTFTLQSDGNAVIYRGSTPLWHTHTNGKVASIYGNYIEQVGGALNIYMINNNKTLTQVW